MINFFKNLYYKIKLSPFVQVGLCKNHWLWFHMLAAQVISAQLSYYVPALLIPQIIFIVALIWERLEKKINYKDDDAIIAKEYGSLEYYKYDTLADVIVAVVVSVVQVFYGVK